VTTAEHRQALRDVWTAFVDGDFRQYSPLYARIGAAVAQDDELLDFVADAPPESHLPLSLLAAVHYLVLAEPASALGRVYAGEADVADAPRLFAELCRERRDDIARLLESRRIQTNEVGRSAVLALGLAAAEQRVGAIGTLVDAGASAGLNLRYDAYALDYGRLGTRGTPDADVTIACHVDGLDCVPEQLPTPRRRVGVDRTPIDLAVADNARWLLACIWPDTGRLARARASIEAARADPPTLVRGDLSDPLDPIADRLDGAVVVMSSLAVSYLDADGRRQLVDNLRARAADRPVAWVALEPAGVAPGTEDPGPAPVDVGTTPALLTLTVFPDDARATVLGWAHPHGGQLHWVGRQISSVGAAGDPRRR
jgi:hypothetical protein